MSIKKLLMIFIPIVLVSLFLHTSSSNAEVLKNVESEWTISYEDISPIKVCHIDGKYSKDYNVGLYVVATDDLQFSMELILSNQNWELPSNLKSDSLLLSEDKYFKKVDVFSFNKTSVRIPIDADFFTHFAKGDTFGITLPTGRSIIFEPKLTSDAVLSLVNDCILPKIYDEKTSDDNSTTKKEDSEQSQPQNNKSKHEWDWNPGTKQEWGI